MPLVKRLIEPLEISRKKVGAEVKNELECVSNNTLSCVVQQLSSLSRQSEDLFGELFSEVFTVAVRSTNLSARIEGLKQKICLLNPTDEEVLLQEINQRKPFKSSSCRDQNLIAKPTRPFSIDETYKLCEVPPALNKLDVFREDGKDSLKFYTNPGYFAELWVEEIKASQLVQKKHKHRASSGHNHQSSRPGHSGGQRSVRTPKNRLEQYKQLKHGPEFVDKVKRDKTNQQAGGADSSIVNNINNSIPIGSNSIMHSPSNGSSVGSIGKVVSLKDNSCNAVTHSTNVAMDGNFNNNNNSNYNINSNTSEGNINNNNKALHHKNKINHINNNNNVKNNNTNNNNNTISPLFDGDKDGGRLDISSPVSLNDQQQQQYYQQQHHTQHHHSQHHQQVFDSKNDIFPAHNHQNLNIKHINNNNNNDNNVIDNNNNNRESFGGNVTPTNSVPRPQKLHNSSINHVRPSAPPPAPPVANHMPKKAFNQEKPPNETAPQHNHQLDMSLQEEIMNKLSLKHDNQHTHHSNQHTHSQNHQHHSTHHHHHSSYKYDLPPPPSPPPSLSDNLDDAAIPPPPPPTLIEPTTTTTDHSQHSNTTNDNSPSYIDEDSINDDDSNKAPPNLPSLTNQKTPSARDSRSDLLSAIREGIQLRRVEETRQKNEDSTSRKEDPGGLDVQSIMEAAFEMRRKVLEDDEEEDGEEESNWSD